MKKILNGIEIDLTIEEVVQRQQDEIAWNNGALDRAMANLRAKRNKLLADTDYLALSDNTLSNDMSNYRQSLRDITIGLSTLEQVNSVEFPVKP